MEKLYFSKTYLKMGGEGDTFPSSHPPGSAPGHKLQKPSTKSGIFQAESKKGHGTMPPALNTLLNRM